MQVKPATNEPRTTPVGEFTKSKCLMHIYQYHILFKKCHSVASLFSFSLSLFPAEERRLFVGMLSRELSEEDVRHMFSQFGHVEDVSILRNAQGTSKGLSLFLSLPLFLSPFPSLSPSLFSSPSLHLLSVSVSLCLPLSLSLPLTHSYSYHCTDCYTGAAFVRMGAKSQALQAITALHQSQTMPVSLYFFCYDCLFICVSVNCFCVCLCVNVFVYRFR